MRSSRGFMRWQRALGRSVPGPPRDLSLARQIHPDVQLPNYGDSAFNSVGASSGSVCFGAWRLRRGEPIECTVTVTRHQAALRATGSVRGAFSGRTCGPPGIWLYYWIYPWRALWAASLRSGPSRTIGIASAGEEWRGSRFSGWTVTATSSDRSRDAWRRTGRMPHGCGPPSVEQFLVSRPGKAAFSKHFAARLSSAPISLQSVNSKPGARLSCEPLSP